MPLPRPTLIDTDPGIDDAVAILLALASPEFDIRGVTTVAGNIGLATTTRNALRLLALARRTDIPVIAGAAKPLVRAAPPSIDIHGRDGLGGVALPEPAATPAPGEAAAFLAAELMRAPAGSVDLLALGPLTNIARLVEAHPEAAWRIGRLVAMGGAIAERGNVGPRAEFNLATDPEAADTVFRAGLPVTLIPLDVTRRVRADRDWTAALRATERPFAIAAADLVDAYFAKTAGGTSRPLHDPCVMLRALRPELFTVRRLALAVDCGDGPDAGALTPDAPGGAPVDVAIGVDAPAALALLADRLGA